MGTHFLCNQNRKLFHNSKPPCHGISRCIRSYGKLSHCQSIMIFHNLLANQVLSLLRILKVVTGIFCNFSLFKAHPEILKLEFSNVYVLHMEKALCPCQNRRGEYFTYRNVHISHTVFKIRLFLRICQLVKRDFQVRFICSPPGNCHILRLIQNINQLLLHIPVPFIIQRIDPDRFRKDLPEILSNRRNRKRNNRKTGFISGNILIYNGHGLIGIGNGQLLLLFA